LAAWAALEPLAVLEVVRVLSALEIFGSFGNFSSFSTFDSFSSCESSVSFGNFGQHWLLGQLATSSFFDRFRKIWNLRRFGSFSTFKKESNRELSKRGQVSTFDLLAEKVVWEQI
jgi:hypothetical protein